MVSHKCCPQRYSVSVVSNALIVFLVLLTLPRKFESVHRNTTTSKRMSPRVCLATPPTSELCGIGMSSRSSSAVNEDRESRSSRDCPSASGASRFVEAGDVVSSVIVRLCVTYHGGCNEMLSSGSTKVISVRGL